MRPVALLLCRELGSRTDGSHERLLLQEICTFDSDEGPKASGAEQARLLRGLASGSLWCSM